MLGNSISPRNASQSEADPSSSAFHSDGDAVYRKVALRIVPILVVGYFFGYLDRVNIGFAKLQMLNALGMSELVYGVGAGIFFWGYLLFQVPCGLMIERLGTRKCLGIIMVSWGIISMLTIFTAGPVSFYLLRFLLGAVEAGFFPGVIIYFNMWFPSHRQSRILSFLFLATPLGVVIGGPLSGFLMDATGGFCGLLGWQWLFLVEAAPAVILGAFLFWYLDDSVDQARWLTPGERNFIASRLVNENAHKTGNFIAALRSPVLWLLVAISFFFNIGNYGLIFWLPTIIQELGSNSVLQVSLLSAIPYAVGCIVMTANAFHSQRSGERRWHSALPPLVGSAALALSTFYAADPAIALFFLTIGISSGLALLAMFWGIPGRLLAGSAAAGGVGFINSWAAFAGFLAPILVGWLTGLTGDTAAGVRVLALSLLVSGVLILTIPKGLFSRVLRP